LILFVGNLTKTKGIHVLIRSFSEIVKEFPTAELLIVTHASKEMLTQETRAILPTINALHLERKVAFMGITSRFPEVLAACDVFVVPFLNTLGPSDLPLPLVEAMAMAKPVVATKVGGISELLTEESGSLTIPNNSAYLADAIIEVLRNRRAAQRRATKASESVRARFSVSRVANMTQTLFEEVARLR
jgi:glycosyltransferase involved in cell wall biosynthesis